NHSSNHNCRTYKSYNQKILLNLIIAIDSVFHLKDKNSFASPTSTSLLLQLNISTMALHITTAYHSTVKPSSI
ncbi:16585_t:CDS:1, partial [Racocetra persica]